MLPAGHRPATSSLHYTTNCNTQSSAPEDGQNNCPKHVDLTGIINKPLLLHLVCCLYYLIEWLTVKQISDNEIYLLIKYIKSVLWRVAKRLSYIEDARWLKVKGINSVYREIYEHDIFVCLYISVALLSSRILKHFPRNWYVCKCSYLLFLSLWRPNLRSNPRFTCLS
jgi:hypothetical protein